MSTLRVGFQHKSSINPILALLLVLPSPVTTVPLASLGV